MNKYLIGAAAIAIVFTAGVMTGRNSIQDNLRDAELAYRTKEAGLRKELDAEKAKIKVKYVQVHSDIKGAVDPSGCLDARPPAVIADGLRKLQGK